MPREYVPSLPNGERSGRRRGSRSRGGRVAGHASVGKNLADEIQRAGAVEALVVRLPGEIGIVGGCGFAGTRKGIVQK